MAMIAGGTRGGFTASINMTPMIDVLLVLLIIFMVVQASLQRGISVHVPAHYVFVGVCQIGDVMKPFTRPTPSRGRTTRGHTAQRGTR